MSRTILVNTTDGQYRVENIPDNAKVTFSAVNPGAPKGYGNENALRIYTSQNNQLAVFVGVINFRDESLKVTKKTVTKTEVHEAQEVRPTGTKSEQKQATKVEWVAVE